MPTEEYRVTRATFSPPGPNPPTTRITMDVQHTNDPPTKVPQVKVIRSSAGAGTGFEIEQTIPPPPPTVALYAQVNLEDERFDELRTKLKDKLCKVHLRYQSVVLTGNDSINSFEPIYVY